MSELYPDGKDLFLFVHIPKTAGTSLRSMFMENMELNKDFIHLGPAGYKNDHSLGLKPFSKRTYHDRNLARVILGHDVNKDTHKLVPGKRPKYAVFLRNPAARIVSLYNYEMHTVYSKKRSLLLISMNGI